MALLLNAESMSNFVEALGFTWLKPIDCFLSSLSDIEFVIEYGVLGHDLGRKEWSVAWRFLDWSVSVKVNVSCFWTTSINYWDELGMECSVSGGTDCRLEVIAFILFILEEGLQVLRGLLAWTETCNVWGFCHEEGRIRTSFYPKIFILIWWDNWWSCWCCQGISLLLTW